MAWIFVVNEAGALAWILKARKMGFRQNARRSPTKSRIQPGDPCAIYVSRHAWHNPKVDSSQIAAIGVVKSPVVDKPVTVLDEVMPQSCSLDLKVVLPERQGAPFRPLVGRLRFIGTKEHWATSLRRTVVEIDQHDFEVIATFVIKTANKLKVTGS
jgi:hypothetical protein